MSRQIKVTIKENGSGTEIVLLHDTGRTLLHTMREGGVELPPLCSGLGKCGRCQVQFRGYSPLPTQSDRAALSPAQLREGYRLACMARPMKDCVVEMAFPEERKIDVVTISHIGGNQWANEDGTEKRRDLLQEVLLAVDIGTTTVAMQMIDTSSGQLLDTYTCLNPQRSYGTDVISRIQAGVDGNGETLQRLIKETLLTGIRQMEKNCRLAENRANRKRRMVIAANTAMGHLLMGYPVDSLGKSPFRPVSLKAGEVEGLGMPAVLVPGISAFVGGDIVSGLYACGLCGRESHGTWLFLDLGTNAEMIIGSGGRMIGTAAAAGPAFEGRGVHGATGAERIGAIARLLEMGYIDETGLLAEPYFSTGMAVETKDAREKIWITQEDIRDIQMAKAAVRTGIHFLMEKLGIAGYEEIEKVYVAGGFGFYLDPKAAAGIGLLPEELTGRIETVGNTSLAGAVCLGRAMESIRCSAKGCVWNGAVVSEAAEKDKNGGKDIWKEIEEFAEKAETFQLAEEPQFEQVYVDYMNFPMI